MVCAPKQQRPQYRDTTPPPMALPATGSWRAVGCPSRQISITPSTNVAEDIVHTRKDVLGGLPRREINDIVPNNLTRRE